MNSMALKPFLTFTFLFFAPISHVSSIDSNSSDFAKAYLKHYGYLQHADGNIESAMKLFQQSHEIKATASLDAETLSAMKRPRCGVPDVNLMQRNRSAYALIPGHPKWPFFHLSYVLRNFPDAAKPQLESALDKWSHVSGFTFSENKGFYDHDLSIGFYRLDHGDPYPFDGPGGVLAHSFAPTNGGIHFDDDELWSFQSEHGKFVDFESVALHEIGHALGLNHSDHKRSVMNPYFSPNEFRRHLTKDDIQGIRALYPH